MVWRKLKLWFQRQVIYRESITMLLLLSFWYKASVFLQIYTTIHFDPLKEKNSFSVSVSAKQFALFYIIMFNPTLCSGFVVNILQILGFGKKHLWKIDSQSSHWMRGKWILSSLEEKKWMFTKSKVKYRIILSVYLTFCC